MIYALAFIALFVGAVWLAGNPFEFTQRIPSEFVKAKGLGGHQQLDDRLVGRSDLRHFRISWTRPAAWGTAPP